MRQTGLTTLSDLVSSAPSGFERQLSPSNEACWIGAASEAGEAARQTHKPPRVTERHVSPWGLIPLTKGGAFDVPRGGGRDANFFSVGGRGQLSSGTEVPDFCTTA